MKYNSKGEPIYKVMVKGSQIPEGESWDSLSVKANDIAITLNENSLKPEIYPEQEYEVWVNFQSQTFSIQDPNAEGPIPGS